MKLQATKFSQIFFIIFFSATALTFAQTTAFNFQGFLNDGGTPANGRYDLQFKLFPAIAGGSQVGATVERPNTMLVNGVFSVKLDFGPVPFYFGDDRFLEISVRPSGSQNAFVVLGGRQQILSAPLAIRAGNAGAANYAASAGDATNAANAANADKLGGAAAAEYVRRNVANTGDLEMSGNLKIGGSTTQAASANGLPKAIAYVGFDGQIFRCYNGVTGAASAGCGFSVTQPLGNVGVYRIDFGFSLANRFAQITPEYFVVGDYNKGANFKFVGNFLEVFTFAAGNSTDTTRANFIVFLY